MKYKKIIIVGHKGQDGQLLLNDLVNKGASVIGIGRKECIFPKNFSFDHVNIDDSKKILKIVGAFKPDQIYYLAAYHRSSERNYQQISIMEEYERSWIVNVKGLINFLSAIYQNSLKTKLFYASSSLIFSGINGPFQNENTPLSPKCCYGISKATGGLICKDFRENYKVFASTGILYNHESHLRSKSYLSTKIIQSAISISKGNTKPISIGNLNALVDWGYAKDFVTAFQNILDLENADDFIVSTGSAFSVRDFINIVFEYFKIDPKKYIIEDPNVLTRINITKIGDSRKLQSLTGWKPTYDYKKLIIKLIEDHLNNTS